MIPSLLTEWIDIYSRTKVKDEFGILQEVWTIFTRLKTKPVNRRSYEKVINEQVLPTDVTSFQIRYSRTIDETMILVYYGKVFDIRSLEHIKRTDTTITVERSKLALSDITPVSFDVTFEVNVGGTSDPLGVVPANKGDIIPYTAIPEDLYEFSHWVVDGVDSPEQLNYIQVVKASVLTPVFTSLPTLIQDVFGTTTIDQKFIDQVGNNDVTYKNVQVGTFNGVSDYVEVANNNNATFSVVTLRARIKRSYGSGDEYNTIITSSFTSAPHLGVSLYISRNDNFITVYNDGFRKSSLIVGDNVWTDVAVRITSGTSGTLEASIDNEQTWDTFYTGNVNNETNPSGIKTLIGCYDSSVVLNKFKGLMSFCEMEVDGAVRFSYNFQDGDDFLNVDTSSTGSYGTYMGNDLESFRGTRIDNTDSVLILNGYSSFQQIADPTKFIYAPYTDAGVPTHTSIAGYEEPIEIPKNVVSDNKITYDGVLALSGTDNTFTEINSLENSDTIEITKDENTVSNLKVKG